jgi:hypothetical protein
MVATVVTLTSGVALSVTRMLNQVNHYKSHEKAQQTNPPDGFQPPVIHAVRQRKIGEK